MALRVGSFAREAEPSSQAAIPTALEWVGLHSILWQPIAQLWPSWVTPGMKQQIPPNFRQHLAGRPVSTWIWLPLRCQVYNPALSKLLGGQKGNPHTEAFHSRDLACCRFSPGCLKSLLGSSWLQPTELGAHCMPGAVPRTCALFSPYLDEAGVSISTWG